jgi:hypothetical protein
MGSSLILFYGTFLVSLLVLWLVMTGRMQSKEHFPKVEEDQDEKRELRDFYSRAEAEPPVRKVAER